MGDHCRADVGKLGEADGTLGKGKETQGCKYTNPGACIQSHVWVEIHSLKMRVQKE